MDEPLGALDKKLREHMQIEIKQIHRELGVTIVYVTHDQSEALTMSDRVAVFDKRRDRCRSARRTNFTISRRPRSSPASSVKTMRWMALSNASSAINVWSRCRRD